MDRIRPPLCAALLALTLAACSGSGGYPSLALRPGEPGYGCGAKGTMMPVPRESEPAPSPSPPTPPSAGDLSGRLSAVVGRAQAADQTFADKQPRVASLVAAARGAAVASESWSVASIALGELETARSSTVIALTDLDQLYAEERILRYGSGAPDAEAIAGARAKVQALVDRENDVLLGLRRQLGV